MRRSISGPVIVIAIGVLFFFNNFFPQLFSLRSLFRLWPFLLIGLGVIRLVEVLAAAGHAQPIVPPRRSSWGLGWILFLCFAAWGVSQAMQHHAHGPANMPPIPPMSSFVGTFGSEFDFDVSQSLPVTDADKRLVLDGVKGNVTISGGDSAVVGLSGHRTIHAFAQAQADMANRQMKIEMTRRGNDIVLHAVRPGDSGDLSVAYDLELNVPRHMGLVVQGTVENLTAQSLDGDVDLARNGGNVRLMSIGGNVTAESTRRRKLFRAVAVKGDVDVRGTGGDLQIEDVTGQVTVHGEFFGTLGYRNLAKPLQFKSERTDLRVEKLPGSITIDPGDITVENMTGPFRLRCHSRDVHLSDFTGEVEVSLDRGDIELNPQHTPLGRMNVRTGAGEIELTIPQKAGFELHASTSQGDVDNQYGNGITTFSQGRSASMQSDVAGGPPIILWSGRGDIRVKK